MEIKTENLGLYYTIRVTVHPIMERMAVKELVLTIQIRI